MGGHGDAKIYCVLLWTRVSTLSNVSEVALILEISETPMVDSLVAGATTKGAHA